MTDTPNPIDPAQAVSQLGESLSQTLAQTGESQRALVKEMTGFAKDESLRFVNLRLERNGAALDKLQHCQGIPGLIGVQQEWLRDLLQDYTGQSMRMLGAWRGLTKNVMETAAESAADNIDEGAKRRVPAVRGAIAGQHPCAALPRMGAKLVHETGLADPRIADDVDDSEAAAD